jgi:hypothetical protein
VLSVVLHAGGQDERTDKLRNLFVPLEPNTFVSVTGASWH